MRGGARAAALALMAVALAADRASACSCVNRPSVPQQLSESDAVFVGRAVAKRPTLAHPLSETVTTFEVSRVWKGARDTRIDVLTDNSILPFGPSGGCDFRFDRDSSYVVFARGYRGGLYTGLCNGTMPTSYPDPRGQRYIDSTLRELGPGAPPLPGGGGAPAWVWGIAAAAVGAGVWTWRRRRPVMRGG